MRCFLLANSQARQSSQGVARTDLKKENTGFRGDCPNTDVKLHGTAQMCRVICWRHCLLGRNPRARNIRDVGNTRRFEFDAFNDVSKRLECSLHHARMKGMRGMKRSKFDIIRFQPFQQLSYSGGVSGNGAQFRCVDRRNFNALADPAAQLFGRAVHRGHTAGRKFLHQTAACGNHCKRILE